MHFGTFFNFLQINLRQYVCNSNYYIQKSIKESKNLHPKQVIAIRNNPKEKVMRGKQCSFFLFEPLFEIVNWAWNTNVPVDTTQQAGLGMRKIQITFMNNTTYPHICIFVFYTNVSKFRHLYIITSHITSIISLK